MLGEPSDIIRTRGKQNKRDNFVKLQFPGQQRKLPISTPDAERGRYCRSMSHLNRQGLRPSATGPVNERQREGS